MSHPADPQELGPVRAQTEELPAAPKPPARRTRALLASAGAGLLAVGVVVGLVVGQATAGTASAGTGAAQPSTGATVPGDGYGVAPDGGTLPPGGRGGMRVPGGGGVPGGGATDDGTTQGSPDDGTTQGTSDDGTALDS